MPIMFDFEKEYGLVLEGGGAKGAYQIGVYKALLECKVKIKGIAGVSVGALNGALICMGDYEKAQSLWEDITYSQIMNVDNDNMAKLIKGDITGMSLNDIRKETTKIIAEKGIDVSPLKNLIEDYVDEDKIRNSSIEFIIGTFVIPNMKELEIEVKDVEPGLINDYLLASANLPGFKKDKVNGKKYMDGGIVNNVPIDMLINRGYKDVIVIRIFGPGLEKKIKIPEDVNLINIAPRVDLGNILEFDPAKSRRNLKIGYYDGLRILKNLDGKIYYIESTNGEEYYVNLLCNLKEEIAQRFLEFYKIDSKDRILYTRQLFEVAYPRLALELKLEKNWTYKELYLSMLELCAKNLRIQKYMVYQEKDLFLQIGERYHSAKEKGILNDSFIEIVLDVIVNT